MAAASDTITTRPIHVRARDAASYALTPGEEYRFLFSGIPGEPELIDAVAPRGAGPPLHRHPWASWEVVIEGRIRFVVDGAEIVAEAGDGVYTPPNAAHTFIVESERARVIAVNHPSGPFESLTRRAIPLFNDPAGPDLAAIAALAAEHGVDLLGPPMTLDDA